MASSLLPAAVLLGSGCGRTGNEARPPERGEAAGPARLWAVLPSIAVVNEPVTLRVVPLDDLGDPVEYGTAPMSLASTDPGFASEPFTASGASGSAVVTFRTPGLHRVTVARPGGDAAVAGPVRVVTAEEELGARPGGAARRLLWGDAHAHSDVGDGLSPPESLLAYGRDVAHLDWLCISEHDFRPVLEVGLDAEEGSWDRLVDLARRWRRPGFAVLLGWEWSSPVHGHRLVLLPDDAARYVSYRVAPTPTDLAATLRGTGAVSILAHPTGSELTPPVDWDTVVPGFDAAIEVYSGQGGADGSGYRPPSSPTEGRGLPEGMRRGVPLAFVAFSGTHLSRPGNPWPPPIRDAPYRGGLTAIWSDDASEDGVLDALRAGRCYATSGERFYVEFRAGDRTLGETLVIGPGPPIRVQALAAGSGTVDWLEILADDRVILRRTDGRPDLAVDEDVGPFEGEVALWLRGASAAGERFWTTPVRVVRP